jgi:molybdopterin-guanine dinucleotide biosynthesis protein A
VDRGRVAGAILAGGRARRLSGRVKPLLEIGGRTLLARTLDALAPVVAEVFLVGDPALLADTGLRVVPDRRSGAGPLAGLESALAATPCDFVLLVGGDMPFLDAAMLARLRDAAPDAEAVCFAGERGLEPLCARYARTLLPLVSARLDAGELALHALLLAASCHRLETTTAAEWRALTNINTEDDLAAARALAAAPR